MSEGAARPGPRRDADWGRVCAVVLFSGLIAGNVVTLARPAPHPRSLTSWVATGLTILFYLLLVGAYLRRSRTTVTDRDWTAWAAALAATASPFAVPLLASDVRQAGLFATSASIVLVVGLAFMVWALTHLGTNISVVPQARRVVSTGPYGWVRHPLYAAELISAIGLCLSREGWAQWPVYAAMCALQYLRARKEERLLARELDGYDDYRQRTPMLVPRPPR